MGERGLSYESPASGKSWTEHHPTLGRDRERFFNSMQKLQSIYNFLICCFQAFYPHLGSFARSLNYTNNKKKQGVINFKILFHVFTRCIVYLCMREGT